MGGLVRGSVCRLAWRGRGVGGGGILRSQKPIAMSSLILFLPTVCWLALSSQLLLQYRSSLSNDCELLKLKQASNEMFSYKLF